MMIIPMKWMPYILVIAAIGLFAEGSIVAGLVAAAVGSIWLYFKYAGKKA